MVGVDSAETFYASGSGCIASEDDGVGLSDEWGECVVDESEYFGGRFVAVGGIYCIYGGDNVGAIGKFATEMVGKKVTASAGVENYDAFH